MLAADRPAVPRFIVFRNQHRRCFISGSNSCAAAARKNADISRLLTTLYMFIIRIRDKCATKFDR